MKNTFPVPKDFVVPEGTKPGDNFDAMATFCLEEDGSLCLVAIDGKTLEGEEKEAQAKAQPKPKGGAKAMMEETAMLEAKAKGAPAA